MNNVSVGWKTATAMITVTVKRKRQSNGDYNGTGKSLQRLSGMKHGNHDENGIDDGDGIRNRHSNGDGGDDGNVYSDGNGNDDSSDRKGNGN